MFDNILARIEKSEESKNRDFSMVLVKNLKFFHDFIFGKISQQVKKVEESGFFQRSLSMGLVKKLKFSTFYVTLNRPGKYV